MPSRSSEMFNQLQWKIKLLEAKLRDEVAQRRAVEAAAGKPHVPLLAAHIATETVKRHNGYVAEGTLGLGCTGLGLVSGHRGRSCVCSFMHDCTHCRRAQRGPVHHSQDLPRASHGASRRVRLCCSAHRARQHAEHATDDKVQNPGARGQVGENQLGAEDPPGCRVPPATSTDDVVRLLPEAVESLSSVPQNSSGDQPCYRLTCPTLPVLTLSKPV